MLLVAPVLALFGAIALSPKGHLLMRGESFWAAFAAQAQVSTPGEQALKHVTLIPGAEYPQLQKQMRNDGYIEVPNLDIDAAALRGCKDHIANLAHAGLPAQCVFLYGAPWVVCGHASDALGQLFGLQSVQDFFVFNVGPGQYGWGAHRDRGGGESRTAFGADGLPHGVTVWIALSEASRRTSCMHVLPSFVDPHYSDVEAEEEPDPSVTLSLHHQHIRALPAEAGTVLAWSHRLLHWGSASPIDAPEARMVIPPHSTCLSRT